MSRDLLKKIRDTKIKEKHVIQNGHNKDKIVKTKQRQERLEVARIHRRTIKKKKKY